MRATSLLLALALLGPASLAGQVTAGQPAGRGPARPMTRQNWEDACNHRPGARMRLYGCSPEQSGASRRRPIVEVDGRRLPTDTAGPGRAAREAALAALRPQDVDDVQVIGPDSARLLFGERGRDGLVRIRTTKARKAADSLATVPRAGA